ncbi:RidA family protein [Nonomuraea sp. MG754425]|uniref:RidA family protein n=1 Tax=Nonomuraea sp. MG754425 TaxID=2570319 RepID=UPI001F276927|nr:RidA family protein [Nonomuraea sp. MG754425]MCF6476117.1 RidA family protein [Nonomuraea sp. MG754425]
MLDPESRVRELGLEIPDFSSRAYYGADYGSMKPHHITGDLLFLGGHTADDADGNVRLPGRLGADLTVEQGYEAARLTALNCLGGIRYALGSLNRVKSLVRSLCFVVTTPEFEDVHKVSSGATDLFREVFGPEAGLGGRATIGVMSLARRSSFETWLTVEINTAEIDTGRTGAVEIDG